MKIPSLLFLLLIHLYLQGQDLRNTEWIKVKAERKDGSKIIDHFNSGNSTIKYFFKDSTVLISTNEQYSSELKYSIKNNTLCIGSFVTYTIDTVDNIVLAITEIPSQELSDDKINSYAFINNKFLFEYLNQIKEVTLIGDSVIQCDNHISPTYQGNLANVFQTQFSFNTTKNRVLAGSFMISTSGNIKNVQIDSNNDFSEKEVEKVKSFIFSTEGLWILPKTTKPLGFKIDFAIEFKYIKSFSTLIFWFHNKDPKKNNPPGLTIEDIRAAGVYFREGVKHFEKGKFENATDSFKKCIATDSTYIDAYYNLAASYLKLGNSNMACETWGKLKEMGQIKAITFYRKNCK